MAFTILADGEGITHDTVLIQHMAPQLINIMPHITTPPDTPMDLIPIQGHDTVLFIVPKEVDLAIYSVEASGIMGAAAKTECNT